MLSVFGKTSLALVSFFFFYFILGLAHNLHQSTDFDDLYIIWRVSAQEVHYGGRDETAPHLERQIPNPEFLWHK